MLCKNCEHSELTIEFWCKGDVFRIDCAKHGISCDTAWPNLRQCIEDDCDVLWRAAREKGSRYDG